MNRTFASLVLLLTAFAVPAITSPARAVSLVVMNVATNATNSAIPVGEQVVTFGIKVAHSDLNGAGTNPVLFVQNLTFAGNGLSGASGNPFNGATGATNEADVQHVQSEIIDPIAENKGAPVVSADLSGNAKAALYADSWWYNSGNGLFGNGLGLLSGVNDASGNPTTLTDPAWQLGPIGAVGTTGFVWTPTGTSGVQAGTTPLNAVNSATGTNATSGQFMMYSGFYGPLGSNGLTGSILAGQFVGGFLTVPIAQIVTSGDVHIPGNSANAGGGVPGPIGSGTYIGVVGVGVQNGRTGNGTYNVVGGDPTVDPRAFYSFAKQSLVPEPSTLILAALGGLALLVMRRRK